jgi:hypothetical protein
VSVDELADSPGCHLIGSEPPFLLFVFRQSDRRSIMPKESSAQREVMERVMHEFKHGELATSTGAKVKSRDQAIAIGLREAGASETQTPKEKKSALRHTKRRESRGETARQRDERRGSITKAELYERAKKRHIPGRSRMSKDQLRNALGIG